MWWGAWGGVEEPSRPLPFPFFLLLLATRGPSSHATPRAPPFLLPAPQNWDYKQLIDTFNSSDGDGWSVRVKTEAELLEALRTAQTPERKDRLAFIECIIDRDDCSSELLEWGSRVAAANGRGHAVVGSFVMGGSN